MGVRRTASRSRTVELKRADLHEGRDMSVIRVVLNDHLLRTSVGSGYAQSQIVGLRSGIDEEGDA